MRYKYKRYTRRRYLTTLIVSGAVLAASILGSVTGVVQAAGFPNRFMEPAFVKKVTTTKPTTTTSTTPTTTTPTPASTPAPTIPPVVTPAPVVTSQVSVPVAHPDTAVASQATTSAQAATNTIATPVTYTSHQISDELRDRLILLASILGASGAALYAMTLIGPRRKPITNAIPITHIIPVEVVAH